ncbi:MAG: BglG family transcription antiterminator [Bacillota bacterium]
MLTERGIKILQILTDKNKISISKLANIFELSERSIRYDIEKINTILKNNKLPLIKKVSGGKILIPKRNLIINYIDSLDNLFYSSKSRQKFILYKSALTNVVNIHYISKELNVSRTTIKKDVEKVKIKLSDFNLKLVQNHNQGLILTGKENDIRSFQLTILSNKLKDSKINELLIRPLINNFFKDINLTKINKFINIIETKSNNIISDQGFHILKMYIAIAINRNKKGNPLKKKIDNNVLLFTPEYKVINKEKESLENYFKVSFNKAEIIKITNIFIGSPSYNFPNDFYKDWYEIEMFVNKLIHNFSNKYGLELSDDKELTKDLITYLKPILNKPKEKININQSNDAHIIELYPGIYQIILNILKKEDGFNIIKFNKNHILAITIYFIASVERNKYKKKTIKNILIVCGMGYGTSKLIELQLKQKYNINILDSIPFHHLKNYKKINKADIIITTCKNKFKSINKPIVKVNPHLSSNDFNKLNKYNLQKLERQIPLSKLIKIFNKSFNKNEKSDLLKLLKNNIGELIIDDISTSRSKLLDFLPIENIFIDVEARNWKEAIKQSGDLLKEKGYVNENYIQSLIEAFEKYNSYMVISDKIAIPHARNNKDILKTGMVLITLKEKVKVPSGKELKTLLTFSSFDNLEHLDALSEFSDLLLNSNFKEFIVNAQSPEEIRAFIKENIN